VIGWLKGKIAELEEDLGKKRPAGSRVS
jgi:hypothetical protein